MVESSKRPVPREKWQSFFDEVSEKLLGKGVDITLSSNEGMQHQSSLWQLHGVTYDPHDDALIVSCRQQEHVIDHPERINIEGYGKEVSLLEVVTRSGGSETVRFLSPLLLTAS